MNHHKLTEYVLPGRLPIFVARKYPGEHDRCGLHDHEYSEIAVILNGTAQHMFDGKLRLLRKGDMVVLHPGMIHNYVECDRAFELVNIAYDFRALALPLLDGADLTLFKILFPEVVAYNAREPVMTLNAAELERLLELSERLHHETVDPLPGSMVMTLALFLEIVTTLARHYRGAPMFQSTRFMLGKTIAYLNSHYAENVSIAELARQAGVSERNLFRLFRVMTGFSPHHYQLNLRINHASEMLLLSDASLEEIAGKCGFCDANHLCKQFRKVRGITPQKFRRTPHPFRKASATDAPSA